MKSLAILAFAALLGLSAEDPIKTSFAVLASYTYEAGKALPDEVMKLDQKVVSISGFMQREVPGSGPVNSFLLINDACGCNGTPKLNEIVFCTLAEGVTMETKAGIVTVIGKLYAGEQKEEGVVVALYSLDADTVK